MNSFCSITWLWFCCGRSSSPPSGNLWFSTQHLTLQWLLPLWDPLYFQTVPLCKIPSNEIYSWSMADPFFFSAIDRSVACCLYSILLVFQLQTAFYLRFLLSRTASAWISLTLEDTWQTLEGMFWKLLSAICHKWEWSPPPVMVVRQGSPQHISKFLQKSSPLTSLASLALLLRLEVSDWLTLAGLVLLFHSLSCVSDPALCWACGSACHCLFTCSWLLGPPRLWYFVMAAWVR